MLKLRNSNLFDPRPGFGKGWLFFVMSTCSFFIVTSFSNYLYAAESCAWIPTGNHSIEQIKKKVEERSGKAPTISCGAGADFKVCHSCEDRLTVEQWRKVQKMLGQSSYRQWHSSWHSNSFTDASTKARESGGALKAGEIQGENFFFAHREMFRNVQANLAAMGLPCISPWTELPKDADDPVWPNVSASKFRKMKEKCDLLGGSDTLAKIDIFNTELRAKTKEISDANRIKQQELEGTIKDRAELFQKRDELWKASQVQTREARQALLVKHALTEDIIKQLRDCPTNASMRSADSSQKSLYDAAAAHATPQYLKGSLGNLGHEIEGSWHGSIHYNYNTEQPSHCSSQSIAPECDDMGSPFSSHINIHFYKAHGLIDEYIEKWLKANNYEVASKNCSSSDKKCYKWKGTYTGDMPDFVTGKGCTLDTPISSSETSAPKVRTESGER